MSDETFVVSLRPTKGKSAAKVLRKEGNIPAVVYGLNEPPAAIAIAAKVVARILASETGMNSVVYMQREGTDIKRHVIIKDVQRDPVTRRLVHVDFLRVDPNHKVKVHVPVRLQGVPASRSRKYCAADDSYVSSSTAPKVSSTLSSSLSLIHI